jgi:IclR family transcriptional regulator, acetate operon repressor
MDVKSAGRTMELFEAFARAQTPLSLSEIARALGAPASSCFNLIRALEARGYLYLVEPKRLYPTHRLFEIARTIAAREPWIDLMEPILTALRDDTRETVILGKRQGNRVIYLEVFEGPQTIRYSARAGDLKPLHSSSIGKAMLGMVESVDLAELLKNLPLNQVTKATITNRQKLIADLARSRRRGFFMTVGENVADVTAIATGLRLNSEVYGIAIAGPMSRMRENLAEHVSALKTASISIAHLSRERDAASGISGYARGRTGAWRTSI